MKLLFLIPFQIILTYSYGQSIRNKLFLEFSPFTIKTESKIFYSIQGRIDYQFNKHISLSARHNQNLKTFFTTWKNELKPNPYKKSSFTELVLGITLFNSVKPENELKNIIPIRSKQFLFDLGVNYYRHATTQPDFFSYDKDSIGNYKIINSINRFSASLGFTYVFRKLTTKDPANILIKRQHLLSAGFFIGINYDLQGFIQIPEENPSIRPPKNYSFQIGGFYARYNFRQQLTKHLFLGTDLLFTRMPYVNYRANYSIYVARGGERETPFQTYAGITLGYTF